MRYKVQKWGHNGQKGMWFEVDGADSRAEACRIAGLGKWGSGSAHRVLNDRDEQIFSTEE